MKVSFFMLRPIVGLILAMVATQSPAKPTGRSAKRPSRFI